MRERDGVLGLPMIVNREDRRPARQVLARGVPDRDRDGRGDRACSRARRALIVPRTRFAPVKTTNDLLALRSRRLRLTDDARVELVPATASRSSTLDSDHYKLMRDFDARFPAGPPSLKEADRFEVEGDVTFGADVVVRGR